ncbi:hypothetical protein FACS189490_02990 [Clostridia bacterium]|nr:hypothetical protein FACS189490_02990 [Clostridia bacterium]
MFGANGSGKTTLARELARLLGFNHMDIEAYAFLSSDVPYAKERSREECVRLMTADVKTRGSFVLSAFKGDFGEEITAAYDLTVWLTAPLDVRRERLEKRGAGREFIEFAVSRPLEPIERWAETLICPILRVDGTADYKVSATEVAERFYQITGGNAMTLLYGTSNPAKLESMRRILVPLGLSIIGLRDLNEEIPEVEENGANPLENARLKATAYFKAFNRPVFSCDSALYIEGLTDLEQPGVNVRTVAGKRLSDEEMTERYAEVARSLGGKAVARYRNGICLIKEDGEVFESFAEDLSGERFYIVEKPHEKRVEGFPIDCLSVHIESGKYYYDMPRGADGILEEGFRRFFREAFAMGGV